MVIEKLEKCEDSIGSLDDATDNLAIFAFFIYRVRVAIGFYPILELEFKR